jgi:PKHD-type hydroxylase
MNFRNNYWAFQNVLPHHLCNSIIRYALTKQDQTALTGGTTNFKNLNQQRQRNLFKQRNSKIVWLNDPWIYRYIMPFVAKANINAGWNFQYDVSEQCQFTKYGEGQFYDWHCDSFDDPYGERNQKNVSDEFKGKIRKLSVTVSLSDPNSYRGGELEFSFSGSPNQRPVTEECKTILPKGSIVVFPSYVWHRVKPVLSGTRYSLVIWNCGNPFV